MRLPTISDRLVCCGRTGTGKTVGGLWHLSNYDVGHFPFILIDFKNDENMDQISNVQEIGFDFDIGKNCSAGLYRLRCTPYDLEGTSKKRSRLDDIFLRVWEHGNCGLFIDEAYIIGNSDALNLNYTQGRSLRIPIITNTQRPVWCSRFAFSEASFIQVYDLTDGGDIGRVEEFIPFDWYEQPDLEKYQSFYYDVGEKKLLRLNPVPPMNEIAETFAEKLPKRPVWI